MRRMLLLILAAACVLQTANAGTVDSLWTLERCVGYALEKNISIQQNALNTRLADLNLKQSRLAQLPNANLSTGYGRSFGRSVDPTTNQFVKGSYDFLSFGGNVDVLLFGWFQRRNTIARNGLNAQAARADLDQLRDDVSLNIATGFLRAILARAQIGVAQQQLSLSQAQMDQTARLVTAGRLPELNNAQVQSQVAADSSRLISSIADYNAALLDMRALMNLDFEEPFVPAIPAGADNISLSALGEAARPADVYASALQHFGAIRGARSRVAAAEKGVDVAKGALYPSLSLNAQAGTNFATTIRDYSNPVITGTQPTGAYTDVGGTLYPIYQPTYTFTQRTTPLGRQVDNNFRQSLSLNLNIPIFNQWQAQAAVRQAKIEVENQRLGQYQSELKLKQDVYRACNDAVNAHQKWMAAVRAREAADRAQDFASKRNALGLTTTVEYLVAQNNQFSAAASEANARYDLIFRLKVIDYYMGRPIRL